MIKKTITFENFDGVTVTEDFFFHFTAAEIAEMEVSKDGGLSEYIKRVGATENPKVVLEVFKEIVCRAYGERSEDGKRFIKNQEISDGFATTEAYSQMFVEFITDVNSFTDFISKLVPKNLGMTSEEFKKKSVEEMQGFKPKSNKNG